MDVVGTEFLCSSTNCIPKGKTEPNLGRMILLLFLPLVAQSRKVRKFSNNIEILDPYEKEIYKLFSQKLAGAGDLYLSRIKDAKIDFSDGKISTLLRSVIPKKVSQSFEDLVEHKDELCIRLTYLLLDALRMRVFLKLRLFQYRLYSVVHHNLESLYVQYGLLVVPEKTVWSHVSEVTFIGLIGIFSDGCDFFR